LIRTTPGTLQLHGGAHCGARRSAETMSIAVRGIGVCSQTAVTMAIRLSCERGFFFAIGSPREHHHEDGGCLASF